MSYYITQDRIDRRLARYAVDKFKRIKKPAKRILDFIASPFYSSARLIELRRKNLNHKSILLGAVVKFKKHEDLAVQINNMNDRVPSATSFAQQIENIDSSEKDMLDYAEKYDSLNDTNIKRDVLQTILENPKPEENFNISDL